MCLLLETIKIHNNILHNIELHSARLNRSRKELFGCSDPIDLTKAIRLPATPANHVYKCRVIYSEQISKIEFIPYIIKPVTSLQLVEYDSIQYDHKYLDRKCFDELLQKTNCDDILIIKNGRISKPVKNLRFTQSMIEAFYNLESLSEDTELFNDGGFFTSRVPSMVINNFNFTGNL